MVKWWNNAYKHLYIDKTTLGSADVGFDHILNHFGHANN